MRDRLTWSLAMALVLAAGVSTWAVEYPLRWRWSNPAPHGGNVVDMAYSALHSLAVQVAEKGQVFTSSDLDVWLPRDTGTTAYLRAVAFLGPRLVIVGESGTVLFADDVGQIQHGVLADGPTSDWLEAVAASPSLAVAAGDNGSIYTSPDGALWKKQASGSTAWFRGAAFGSGTFIVVGEDGVIRVSANGTNWAASASPTKAHLNRVGYSGGRFIAVGEGGVAVTSTNKGASWFFESTGATNHLQYSAGGGADLLVDGVREVRLKENAWSNELGKTNGPPEWTYYTALGLPNFFLIAGQTGLQSEGYQVGDTPYFWITPYNSIRNWLWDVVRLPAFYAAVGDYGTILTSPNGVDWTLEFVPPAGADKTLLGIGGTTNMLLAVGDGGTILCSPNLVTNVVITNATGVVTQAVSSLGVLWFSVPKATTNDLQGVGVLSNSLFVAAGGKGTLLTSADGTNWNPVASGTTNLLTSVAEWPGGLVAVGDNGTLLTSANGLTWARTPMPTTNWLYRVRWLNGLLVVVGQRGTIFTSTNATTWQQRTSGTTAWLNDVCVVQDTWFAIGTGGTVLTSTNTVNWTSRGTITGKHLYGVATDSKQLAVVGVEGVILRCQVVPDSTPVRFLNYARIETSPPGTVANLYLFGGAPDQRFTLDRATNVVQSAWTTGPLLEITDGSGTLYYLEYLSGPSLPPTEFYRATLSP